MLPTVRQLPKVRVLLNRRETRKYDITLSQSFRQSRSGNGAVAVEDRTRGGSSAGLSETAEDGGETRVRNVYSDRTIQYNTRTKRTRARFLRSMNRSPPYLRFDSCTRIAYAEARNGRKGDIGLSLLHFQYPLYPNEFYEPVPVDRNAEFD